MPLYEYLCRDCEQQVELLVRSSDKSVECPECGSKKLMKLLSVPSAPGDASKSSGSEPPAEGGSCGTSCGCFPG